MGKTSVEILKIQKSKNHNWNKKLFARLASISLGNFFKMKTNDTKKTYETTNKLFYNRIPHWETNISWQDNNQFKGSFGSYKRYFFCSDLKYQAFIGYCSWKGNLANHFMCKMSLFNKIVTQIERKQAYNISVFYWVNILFFWIKSVLSIFYDTIYLRILRQLL